MIRTILLAVILMISFAEISFGQSAETVDVFRWQDTVRNLYITAAENEYADSQLIKEGYSNKKIVFKAYCDPGPGRIAVYDWYNAYTWKKGYHRKTYQYYAVTR